MKPIYTFAFALFLFASCAKKEDINNAAPDTVVGGILSAKINDAVWAAAEGKLTMSFDSTEMNIYAARNPYSNKLTDMTVHILGYTGPGVYKIGKGWQQTNAVYYNNITPYHSDSGTVTILSEEYTTDTIWVKGVFNFYSTNEFGYHLNITGGTFKMRMGI